uniref:CSON014254 protein n=1 Tax=Culicoides sonorensis TaxID=179676 RepID=A0A336MA98_CULSO
MWNVLYIHTQTRNNCETLHGDGSNQKHQQTSENGIQSGIRLRKVQINMQGDRTWWSSTFYNLMRGKYLFVLLMNYYNTVFFFLNKFTVIQF